MPRTHRLGQMALLANAAAEFHDPATFQEAMASDFADEWHKACKYEMDALAKNRTWTLVDLLPGRKAIKFKWVFKQKADGCFRARLVAKGFTQIQGIDYDETFSPVARFESLRLLLALAVLEDWEIHQMDVKSAFLNGLLDEEIYMEQPEGFVVPGQEGKVCLLAKAIYSLKQASCAWNVQVHGVLEELSFTCTYSMLESTSIVAKTRGVTAKGLFTCQDLRFHLSLTSYCTNPDSSPWSHVPLRHMTPLDPS